MSTYLCHARLGRLTDVQKGEIAEAFTRIHNQVTDGPSFFVQVIFRDVGSGDHFIGGAPAAEDQAWIQGEIRAGRTAEQKSELLTRLVDAYSNIARTHESNVWAYIQEIADDAALMKR